MGLSISIITINATTTCFNQWEIDFYFRFRFPMEVLQTCLYWFVFIQFQQKKNISFQKIFDALKVIFLLTKTVHKLKTYLTEIHIKKI